MNLKSAILHLDTIDESILSNRCKLVYDDAKVYHTGQVRKYTEEPYHTHLLAVAMITDLYCSEYNTETKDLFIACAILHDVLEDCSNVSERDIKRTLRKSGFAFFDRMCISSAVKDLTNTFTKEAYPELSREIRKALEANKWSDVYFSRIFSRHKTMPMIVKCADILHNVHNIVDKDPEFAKVYLYEKMKMVQNMLFEHDIKQSVIDIINYNIEKLNTNKIGN